MSETEPVATPDEVIMQALSDCDNVGGGPTWFVYQAAAVLTALRDAGYMIVRGETNLDHGQMVILRIGLDVQPGDTP